MKFSGFHIEPTNRCVLACAACERTLFRNKFGDKNWHNADLDFDAFVKFIDVDATGWDWELCGNTGDPIYYNRLVELVSWIKSRDGRIVMTTNGSYRSAEWWQELLPCMDSRDQILFSVDGLPTTRPIYRVNSNWESIDQAMQLTVSSGVQAIWKMIPFEFNEYEIDQVRDMAVSRGMQFRLDPSWRWEDVQDLRPRTQQLVKEKGLGEIEPQCSIGNRHYINAGGFYSPCCWSADHRFYHKSQFYHDRGRYDISKNTLSQLMDHMQSFDERVKLDPLPVCSYTCRKL